MSDCRNRGAGAPTVCAKAGSQQMGPPGKHTSLNTEDLTCTPAWPGNGDPVRVDPSRMPSTEEKTFREPAGELPESQGLNH